MADKITLDLLDKFIPEDNYMTDELLRWEYDGDGIPTDLNMDSMKLQRLHGLEDKLYSLQQGILK